MSSIVDYNKDSKLRYNRLYNTKATMLNDFTEMQSIKELVFRQVWICLLWQG